MGWSDDEDEEDSWPGSDQGSDSNPSNDATEDEQESFSGAEKLCDAYDSIKVEHEDPEPDTIPEVIEDYQTRVIDAEREELEADANCYIDADEDYAKPYGFKAHKQILKLYFKLGKATQDEAEREKISQNILTGLQNMMSGVRSNGDHYQKMCLVPLQKLIERGILCDIVSAKSAWKQPPEVVEDLFACLLDTTEKANWRSHSLKVKLSMLEFYLDAKKYKPMPKIMNEVEAFCHLKREDGGAAENVRKNSLMTLKSIQMEYHYGCPEDPGSSGLLDRWDMIEAQYKECMEVMQGENGIVVSDKDTEGRIHEYGGMVQMLSANYNEAFIAFQVGANSYVNPGLQDAFKTGGGNGAEERRLNYMLLAWMHKTAVQNQQQAKLKLERAGLQDEGVDIGNKIDPFVDPDVKNYADSPLIAPMKALYLAFDGGEISRFNAVMEEHRAAFVEHHFIGLFCETLQKFARTQAVLKILETYTAVKLAYLGKNVGYTLEETEDLVVDLILDKLIIGSIDQETATLNLHKKTPSQVLADSKFQSMFDMANALTSQASAIVKAYDHSRIHGGDF